jgi:RNA polymerase sigma factor (sigma-70 family)
VTVPTDVLAQAWSIAHRAAATAVRDHEAEDVAQDTVLLLTEQNLSELRDWRSWVGKVARNRALDVARREHGRRDILQRHRVREREVGPSEQGMRDAALGQVLSVLSDRDAALLLAHLDGATNAELAERFGLANAATVSVTLTRVRTKIRDAFPSAELRELLGEAPRVYDID